MGRGKAGRRNCGALWVWRGEKEGEAGQADPDTFGGGLICVEETALGGDGEPGRGGGFGDGNGDPLSCMFSDCISELRGDAVSTLRGCRAGEEGVVG